MPKKRNSNFDLKEMVYGASMTYKQAVAIQKENEKLKSQVFDLKTTISMLNQNDKYLRDRICEISTERSQFVFGVSTDIRKLSRMVIVSKDIAKRLGFKISGNESLEAIEIAERNIYGGSDGPRL